MSMEGLEGRFHLTEPRRYPDRTLLNDPDVQIRELLEDAVEDEGGQGLGRRSRDAHVVDRAEVLVTPVKVVGNGQAVHEVVRIDQLAGAADVEHDRDAGILGQGPDGEE